MSQVLDRRLQHFQRIRAERRAKAIEKATAPGAPNNTVAHNVMKWKEQQKKRQAGS